MPRTKYAEGTEVSVGRSREEIERTLTRFGVDGQAWMRDDQIGVVTIVFRRLKRSYKLSVRLPPLSAFGTTPSGRWARSETAAKEAREREIRRCFRSLANYIKAILDAIETGILETDTALLPYLVLSTGGTVAEVVQRELAGSQEIDMSRALSAGGAPNGERRP